MNAKINLNKLSAMLIILLIAGFMAPLSTTMAGNGNGSIQEEQTGTANNQGNSTSTASSNSDSNATSENTKQYNRTDVTPKNQAEQINAQEQTVFRYRNMTMTMNCTRNCTVSFTADEEVTPKIFGLTVDANQTMTLAMNLTKAPFNGATVNQRCLNFYLGIEPNAALELQAQIRFYINQTELNQCMNREVNASRLTWMYWNQTRAQWDAVESYMDQNGYLVCDTNHFSTWTVAEIEQSTQTVPEQNNTESGWFSIIVLLAAAIAIVVVFIAVFSFKKRK